MRKIIPKPVSQTVGCGQVPGSLEGINVLRIWRSKCFADHECMVASDSFCIAKGRTSGSLPDYFEVH